MIREAPRRAFRQVYAMGQSYILSGNCSIGG